MLESFPLLSPWNNNILLSFFKIIDILSESFSFFKVVYTVEFQNWGLPQVHILLWLKNKNGLMTPAKVDSLVSVELPYKETDPIAHVVISSFMMHSPCGLINLQAPCMENRKCKKVLP